MSVSRNPGGSKDNYEDIEIQSRGVASHVTQGNLVADTEDQKFSEAPLTSVDPLGGLDKNEIAELVAMRVKTAAWVRPTNDDGVTRMHANLGFSLDDSGFFGDDSGTANDIPTSTALDASEDETLDPDHLWTVKTAASGGGVDATNHSMATGDQSHREIFVDFREDFGRGPLLDRHDKVYEHLEFLIDTYGSKSRAEFQYNVDYYWDLFKQEEPTLRDV